MVAQRRPHYVDNRLWTPRCTLSEHAHLGQARVECTTHLCIVCIIGSKCEIYMQLSWVYGMRTMQAALSARKPPWHGARGCGSPNNGPQQRQLTARYPPHSQPLTSPFGLVYHLLLVRVLHLPACPCSPPSCMCGVLYCTTLYEDPLVPTPSLRSSVPYTCGYPLFHLFALYITFARHRWSLCRH